MQPQNTLANVAAEQRCSVATSKLACTHAHARHVSFECKVT